MSSSTQTSNPVLVELFTSEGCSRCPPADAVLAKLRERHLPGQGQLLLLGEHVDYWNHLGWSDPFSSPAFSQRQNDYARILHLDSVYTPQMVIDGRVEVIGSDANAVNANIDAAAKTPKPANILMQRAGSGPQIHITVDKAGAQASRVMLAITEDALTTSVEEGENGGRTLHHAAVVRQLRTLGTTAQGAFAGDAEIAPQPGWKPENITVIVFVQDERHGTILGGASLKYQ